MSLTEYAEINNFYPVYALEHTTGDRHKLLEAASEYELLKRSHAEEDKGWPARQSDILTLLREAENQGGAGKRMIYIGVEFTTAVRHLYSIK